MEMLSVHKNQIVNPRGQPVYLKGTCVGGWMNMEEFINGYPGSEHGLRAMMAQIIGPVKSQFFFDRWLDYFFAEEDVTYLKSLGNTVVRLALNYRHFEGDDQPFKYLEAGFQRLEQAVKWCEKNSLYVILDLHSVQGWQNTDWHCDNSSRHVYFWQHPHFQDRFIALWEEFARRFSGNATIAGYNVMNEPVTNAPNGRFTDQYSPDWKIINNVYKRVVNAIRVIDPDHIIFLEGDYFSSRFVGLEPPFVENLVYSSHNYNSGGFGPGPYPGLIGGEQWDLEKQRQVFLSHEGAQYSQKYNVPLWVGEFGSAYNGPASEIPDRLRSMNDQISVFEEYRIHWTSWTYKDLYVMGWVQVDPESEYFRLIKPIIDAKIAMATDFWMRWAPETETTNLINHLARQVETSIQDPWIDPVANQWYFAQHALSGYVAGLMQHKYASLFQGMNEIQIDQILASFALRNCRPHQALVDIIKEHCT